MLRNLFNTIFLIVMSSLDNSSSWENVKVQNEHYQALPPNKPLPF